jgi:subtilisin-like proprotein convertase family protein
MHRCLAAVLSCWSTLAAADVLDSTRAQNLAEVSHTVEVQIADGVATYKVRREFANRGQVADQAGLAIDLPAGGAATGLRIRARDRWYDGELMDRDKAAALYEHLTGYGAFAAKDPALLQWLWADRLYLQIFPVLPGKTSTVEYTLTVPTRYEGGRYFVSYPRTNPTCASNEHGQPLVAPTVTVSPAWTGGEIQIDGRVVAPGTAVTLVVPADASCAPSDSSVVTSAIDVPASSHTTKPIRELELDLDIAHTFRGDLKVELVTPLGQRVVIADQEGGNDNDIKGVRKVALPAGTTGAGRWQLVVGDHARLDTGTLQRWKLSFGAGKDATTAASADTPIFIPDAPSSPTEAGVAAIVVAPPAIATWTARLGKVVASAAHAFARFEVDVAPELSALPAHAQLVFVVDASYSVGQPKLDAQLQVVRAYARHLRDAEVEIVAYRRKPTRVFGSFVPARELDGRLAAAVAAHAFQLGNGSALDDATRLAARTVATRSGPCRVIVLTDELLRGKLDPLAGLAELAPDVVVHVVVPVTDRDDRGELVRDDARPLSPLATRHHGILARITGLPARTDADLAPIVLPLVRPTSIDHLAATGVSVGATSLHEGDGIRMLVKTDHAPDRVVLTGQLWSDPVRSEVAVSEEMSRAAAAFVFGADEHGELSAAEQMTVALAGRAVSPVTSYVAAEPGTRPSRIGLREGFDDRNVYGGVMGGAVGGIEGGFGFAPKDRDVAGKVDTRTCVAAHRPAAGWRVTLDVETTRDEIVDVAIAGRDDAFARCLVEAVWAVHLGNGFDRDHDRVAVELR